MKQVVQNYKSGELDVLDVPVPACKAGGVLVATRYSLISTGTELMKVNEGQLSLLGKARSRPDQLRKVMDTAVQLGPVAAYQKAMDKLDSFTPLGYSLAGVVLDVGRGAEEEFAVGQLVACAGNEHALHAEVNWVPTNLCVPVPDGLDLRLASFVTVGAIAMHGVRRGEVALGETACVIGLGLIGQLVTRLLLAAGVRVVGIDPVAQRCAHAESAGALACAPSTPDGLDRIERALVAATDGLGADHVFITASGKSNDAVVAAARVARDRARIVDIGKVGLDVPWNDYYAKELDLRFSRSYGPGRYDPTYELQGIDYPAGYVRWTERRNMASFLDLVASGRLAIDELVSDTFPLDDAVDVYRRLSEGELSGIGFLFDYPDAPAPAPTSGAPARAEAVVRPTAPSRPASLPDGKLRVGFVGAGSYATSMLLPLLRDRDDVELAHVATTTSLSGLNAQRKFGFSEVSTDTNALLDDESVGTVFIVTRHSSHAELASRALARGKTVFVEKPLALSDDELNSILKVVAETGNDRLMVGFNRRFAPLLVDLANRFGSSRGPALVRYLVNAGPLERRSWYRDAATEGTRFEGEGGHFIDTVSWWLGALPIEVQAVAAGDPDDLLVTLRFDDGSVATVAYTTNGSPRHPKETFDAAGLGRVARLDNFRTATLWKGRNRHRRRSLSGADKGQRNEMDAFLTAARTGAPMPIPLADLITTTRATLAVATSLASGKPEAL